MFRDNAVEASVRTAVRMWWTSRLRGRRFAQLVYQAREVTQKRISLSVIECGEPGDARRCRTSLRSCATSWISIGYRQGDSPIEGGPHDLVTTAHADDGGF